MGRFRRFSGAALVLGIAAALLAPTVGAQPSPVGAKMVTAARKLLGTPYNFGGRLRKSGPGIDCQGVIFAAAETVQRCGWKSFSVMPTQTVADKELGIPVPGLSPVASSDFDAQRLEPGDVVFLVSRNGNPAEKAIATLDGDPVWVWHTGLASGEGRWIVGDHFAGRVIEVPLNEYLARYPHVYDGVFILRMTQGPKPAKCRIHPGMGAIQASTAPK